jgi:aminopeptidase N
MSSNSVISEFELPGSKPNYNPDKLVQLRHTKLEVALDLDRKLIVGTSNLFVTTVAENLSSISLDALEMAIEEVCLDDQKIDYEYDGKSLILFFPKPFEADQNLQIAIDYSTQNPQSGITFVLPDDFYPNQSKQAWSQGESMGSSYWFPTFDNPKQIATLEMNVRALKEFKVLSNGLLEKVQEVPADDKVLLRLQQKTGEKNLFQIYQQTIWQQQLPQAVYLTALAIADFVEQKDSWEDIQISYYTSKEKANLLSNTASKTPKMMEFFSQKFGVKYPWPKYYQAWVNQFAWGGMENATMTLNTDRALVDEKAAKDWDFGEILIAHELAHQWFGDWVVIDHWSHLWIKEGMATYSEQLWWEHEKGWEEFQYYRINEQREYISGEVYKRPVVTNIYKHIEDLYDRHAYPKGGAVYHMIRTELGDKNFEKFIQEFLTSNSNRNVNETDILRAAEKVSGKNLRWLFDQYLFSAGHPEFGVEYSWDGESSTAKLKVIQKQTEKNHKHDEIHRITIPIGFGFKDENGNISIETVKVNISEIEQSFYFPFAKKPHFVSFDQNNNYLKTVELSYSLTDLKNQLLDDPDPIAKIYAIEAIAKMNNLQALKALEEGYKNNQFWAVRAEIVEKVAKIQISQTEDFLISTLSDSDSRVRKATLDSLANFKTPKSYQAIHNIAQKGDSESYFVESSSLKNLAKIAYFLGEKEQTETLELLTAALENRNSWNEVVRSGALAGLASLTKSPEALDLIIKYTKKGIVEGLRITALSVLGFANYTRSDDEVQKSLLALKEAAGENYVMIEFAIIGSLSQIQNSQSVSILQGMKEGAFFGRTQRKADEAIEKISKSLKNNQNIETLRKEIEEIKTQNRELKGKVEELLGIKKSDLVS